MADIVLIYPSMDPGKKQLFGLPPLGILYIASVLKREGITVKVIDASIKGYTSDQVVQLVLKEHPKLAGISAVSLQITQAIEIAKKIKQSDNSIKLVLGGAHVNSVKEEIFKFDNNFDFLVYGEGEYIVPELYRGLKSNKFSGIEGLIYKQNEKIVVNQPKQLIKDLDTVPFPDLSLIDLNDYSGLINSKRKKVGSMICSRGCPYNCSFCDAFMVYGKKHRKRSTKNIVDEIEHNHKTFGINEISIKDSTFTVDKEWVKEICNEILHRKLNIKWSCNSRIDTIDEELLSIMKKAGCYSISYGVESGSDKILRDINKGVTLQQIKQTFDLSRKLGLETVAYFMIGNLNENESNVIESMKFAKKIKPTFVLFSIATPYPNTKMYNTAVKKNYLKDKYWYMKPTNNWEGYQNIQGYMNLENLPLQKQLILYKKANRNYYFRIGSIIRVIKSLNTVSSAIRYLKATNMSIKSWLK